MMSRIKLIVIVGPTASGKSDLAIRLAKKYNGEVISADSRQVYKRLDIGTGKVSKTEQRMIPHYLIDVANPKSIFTVAHFQKLGKQAIQKIIKKKKLPIIVGGTGQYIDALIYNVSFPEVPPDWKLRAKLEKQTTEQLFAHLQKLDPERASNIERHNPRRLIRALEIIASLGKVPPLNTYPLSHNTKYDVLWLGLNPKNIEKKINERLQKRLKQGLVAEVKNLKLSSQRLHDLGLEYRWVGQYLDKNITKEEMQKNLEQAIRQYAKRQMTWFKRNKEINWLKKDSGATRLVRLFLSEHQHLRSGVVNAHAQS